MNRKANYFLGIILIVFAGLIAYSAYNLFYKDSESSGIFFISIAIIAILGLILALVSYFYPNSTFALKLKEFIKSLMESFQ